MSAGALRTGEWWARNPFARLTIDAHDPEGMVHGLEPCRWCGTPAPLMEQTTDGGRRALLGHFCGLDCLGLYNGTDFDTMTDEGWEEFIG